MKDRESPAGEGAPQARFERIFVRHVAAARSVSVLQVEHPLEDVIRVTFGGDELAGFVSVGPADHVRIYFPNPATGTLIAPHQSPEGVIPASPGAIHRDYTPLIVRTDSDTGATTLVVDFMVHENPGPATLWARSASYGDLVVISGPRGSRMAPRDATRLVVICDESSLPAASRWLSEVPKSTGRTVIAHVTHGEEWVRQYLKLAEHIDLSVARPTDTGALLEAVRVLGGFEDSVFVFAAGEARVLVEVRRYFRRVLELRAEQVALAGYWRTGIAGFDHNSPMDPSDPD